MQNAGEEFSHDPDFFMPLHVAHIDRFINEGARGTADDKLMRFEWDNFINSLEWYNIK